jgi:8-oxo-dGTP diphosphatase
MQYALDEGIEKFITGALILNKENKILIVTRKPKDFMGGADELPGGNLTQGENLYQGLVREVKEETGMTVKAVVGYIDHFDYLSKSGKRCRQFNFIVTSTDDDNVVLTEHTAYKWQTAAEALANPKITNKVKQTIACYVYNNDFDLGTALAEYEPFDDNEKASRAKVLKFLKTESPHFVRSNLRGHITGSAFLFNTDYSKLLLNHHKFLNKWLCFGGHSDGDENTLNVAKRELAEESGITDFVPISKKIADIDVHPIPKNEKKGEPAHFHYDIVFFFKTTNADFTISPESLELRWVTPEECLKLNESDHIKRIVKKWQRLKQ